MGFWKSSVDFVGGWLCCVYLVEEFWFLDGREKEKFGKGRESERGIYTFSPCARSDVGCV